MLPLSCAQPNVLSSPFTAGLCKMLYIFFSSLRAVISAFCFVFFYKGAKLKPHVWITWELRKTPDAQGKYLIFWRTWSKKGHGDGTISSKVPSDATVKNHIWWFGFTTRCSYLFVSPHSRLSAWRMWKTFYFLCITDSGYEKCSNTLKIFLNYESMIYRRLGKYKTRLHIVVLYITIFLSRYRFLVGVSLSNSQKLI